VVGSYGPPPSYPNLRIPGLNAPLPEGASYGYQPGGWGKPPVNELGVPLYGDVFGDGREMTADADVASNVDKTLWGSLEVCAC
jgi:splicing factor 3B subunit 2